MRSALEKLGFDARWEDSVRAAGIGPHLVARVSGDHGAELRVRTELGEERAVPSGRFRTAVEEGGTIRPTVGDWIYLRDAPRDGGRRIIEGVLPRRTKVARRAAGRDAAEQVVAANVDIVFVVCALGRDVNERRIERFTAIVRNGGAVPVIVINKSDLCPDPAPYVARALSAAPGVEVHAVSALSGQGLGTLEPHLACGRTVALVGTSGAGKTTLINRWLGEEVLPTGGLRRSGKGRHTTTSRQMIMLPSGALVIDTPGLREVGLWTGDEGLVLAFEDVARLAEGCRFTDCRHETEPGCAVVAAAASGELSEVRLESWRRLRREQEHVQRQTERAAAQRLKSEARQAARALRLSQWEKRRE